MSGATQRGAYTAWPDPAMDQHVADLLGRTTEAVVQQVGADLEAIVLVGGFGRGEGGVLRKRDGGLHIVNDFDIVLVYREPFGRRLSKLWVHLRHRRALHRLAESLAREFGMKQVDLTLCGAHALQVAEPKLADYDMQHGHRLLWGDADPCSRMRPLVSTDIPAFEGTWLLRNRGIGLVLARLYLDRGQLHAEDRENFYIEINKAALAMGDALWILAGRYTVQYADRAADFAGLADMGFPAVDELTARYRQAAEYKLRPVAAQYPGVEPEALWGGMTRLFCEFFLWFESTRLKRPFADLQAYAAWLGAPGAAAGGSALRRWLDRHLGATGACPPSLRPLKYDPARSVLFVAAMLAARQGDASARSVLDAWPVPAEPAQAWENRARGLLSLLHPSGEVGRFLRVTAPRAEVAGAAA